jgi:signal transduction histidine kinase
VHDDGAGFDPLAPAHHGRGLNHMRQRAELCGGSFDLTTQRGGPTTIQIQLPAGKIPNESF